MHAAGRVCADRGAALAAAHAARGDLEAKKVKLARLRSTPGAGADKAAEAEREVAEAERRVTEARERCAHANGPTHLTLGGRGVA